MLLSYTNNNIDNNRVMIDDFADQDWFAESDEITSGVIQKNPAILDDQHQFHNVPHQSLQQQNTNVDYLDLNVPVDENVFYSSNGEQSITASTSHYLEVRGEQNISNIGTQIIQSTNSSSVIYNETKGNSIGFQTNQQPLPLLTNFGRDYGTARAQASVMTVPQIRQEPNDGKFTYIDCMPSTSLATLKPYTQEQSQVCQSQIQQLQHPPQQQYYYEQRIFQNEQQQHTQHLPQSFNGQNNFYGNIPSQEVLHQQSAQLVHLESPSANAAASSASISNPINQQNQHSQQHFYPSQQSLQQNHQFNSTLISLIDHQHQPSSFQLPPNYQPPPEQIIGHQPLNTSNAVFSSNQLSQQCNTVESVSVKTVAKKSTKTRRRPSISNQSTNKLINGYEQQTETSSGLDQVAKSLFSNQKTATLEFADPQLAMEFASLMGRCQQLEEQKKSGIDVTSELKTVMDRIADCIVRNTTTSAIKAAQQEQQYASSLSGQFEAFPSTSTISQFPSNNKPAKSRAPRKKPNVAKKSQLPSSVQTSTIITPNSVQQSKAQINSQTFIKQSTDSLSTSTPVQFVAFNPTTQSHPSTYTSSTILANNVRQSNSLQIESSKEEKIISVLVPTTNSSSDNMIYAKRNMRVIAQENEKLIAEKLEKQKEKRRERLTEHFVKMREKLVNPDLSSSFKSKNDSIERLLPYGLFSEPEFSQEFIDGYDAELQRHKKAMQIRQHSIEQRMCFALFREAIDSTQEQCNLLLYLDAEFEHRQLKNEISQWKNICKNEENARKSPTKLSSMMDWEYNEWDDERYQHVLSPKIEELKEEETETEVNISSDSSKSIAACSSSLATPRFASITIQLKTYPLVERNENVAAFFQVKNIEEEKPALAKVNLKLERFLLNEEIGKTTTPILLNGNNEEKPAEITSFRSVRTNSMEEEEKEESSSCLTTINEIIKPVKLKIKLPPKNENFEADKQRSDEKKLRREQKRLRKAERRAARLSGEINREIVGGEQMDIDRKNGDSKDTPQSTSREELLKTQEKSPLKISLKRPVIQQQNNNSLTTSLQKSSLNEEINIPINNDCNGNVGGGLLKLRISKHILVNTPVVSEQNELQNDIVEEEGREGKNNQQEEQKEIKKKKHKKDKSKKRKSEENKKENYKIVEQIEEEQYPAKKVPKIRIKFGGEREGGDVKMKTITNNNNTLLEKLNEENKKMEEEFKGQQTSVVKQVLELPQQKNLSQNDNICVPVSSLILPQNRNLIFADNNEEKIDNKQKIEFSPCCSDDESDELRQRTNQALSQIRL
uniref:GLTSCR protein conserved domain-containing protein n=1 Tax=Meloidogyne incognita TaxID=6306 RepID=A0A914LXC4_MELIC